jgi:23S rRNA (cytosine1962-C5)-methyltransferase
MLKMERISVTRIHPGHPWIFSNEVKKSKTIDPGAVVAVYKGRKCIGAGLYNPHSLIAVRLFSREPEDFDASLVADRLDRALAYRKGIIKETSFRLVHSESDGLPGLVIDKYEDGYVIQIHCCGVALRRDLVCDSLRRFDPQFIYEKSEPRLRRLEGLALDNGLLSGKPPGLVSIVQDRINFLVDIEKGQKTGFFFDLRAIRNLVSTMSRDKTVLDLFCYTGGFALYAARAGAKSVLGIDSSRSAVELARENCRLNGFQEVEFKCADVFDFLRSEKADHDVIILDPPAFAKGKQELANARRGYKEINLQAMKRLNREGILVTTCCSYHVTEDDFYDVLKSAAQDAGLRFRVIGRVGQAADHPVLLGMPESLYLKCFVLQVF